MRAKCIALLPDAEQAKQLGIDKHYHPERMGFNIRVGQEYLVFAITFLGGVPWVDILSQSGAYVYSVPLCLFEIMDGVVSKYWVARVGQNGDFCLWPPSFYTPYYHDDLTNGVPEVVKDFQRVRQLIMEEYPNGEETTV